MQIKLSALKPEMIFIVIGLIFGIAFALINPPFQVPDEPTHYLKVVHLTQGQIFVEKSKVFVDLYSPVPYIIPAFTVLIGKLLGLSVSILFYLGRLANLFFYLIIIFLAIKYTPFLKYVFVLLGLMPMALYEAGSFSSDGFNIAVSFLLIAFILKLAFDDEIIKVNKKQFLIIFILGAALALSKEVYVLLMLIFLIVPKNKFESTSLKYIWFFNIFILSIVMGLLWSLLVEGTYVPISMQVSPMAQLSFIATDSISFVSIYLGSIFHNLSYYLTTFVGSFGWIDTGLDTPLPLFLVYIYVIFLFFAALTDNIKLDLKLNQKLISLSIFLLTFTSIFILEYLTWTVVGNHIIDGVYGRYFIPIAPLLFLAIYNNYKIDFRGKNILIILFIVIILLISSYMIYNRFY